MLCIVGIGIGIATSMTGDRMLGCIFWSMLSTLTVAAVRSRRNLAGLQAHRLLPDELFAGLPAAGNLVLTTTRAHPSRQVRVQEQGMATTAWFDLLPGHERAACRVRWRLSPRGPVRLTGLFLRSSYPFGLFSRQRLLPLPATLMVYPHPEGREGVRIRSGQGEQDEAHARGSGQGDFQGLREYVAGDPVRRLHWPTTARTGRAMVVVRGAQAARAVIIEVAEGRGADWERALSAAAAGIQRHAAAGDAVGLRLGGELLEPRPAEEWRRVLLETLARAERREE
ncbi:MAG: DUF58 domain-containing protein [Myxococcota bacterium]|nr:DUF58 domain-containing protein [Myxococcota bacterium]